MSGAAKVWRGAAISLGRRRREIRPGGIDFGALDPKNS